MLIDSSSPQNERCETQDSTTTSNDVALNTLQDKLENERARTREYLNRLKYLQADFENYKKRTEKEIRDTRQYGHRSLILVLLPVLD
ncbi:MAG: nucleotide exchange factor GrpE [Candidatus Bathyarchaeota archaeon]|nr:MAG: nucleotide exchange factor GrpE [Candidatus Bathyarchaeota archaeon]